MRAQALLTATIFQHSLRIRVIAEVPNSASPQVSPPVSEAVNPAGDTSVPAAEETTPTEEPAGTTDAKVNFAGRLNNLVTSDLENILAGLREVVEAGEHYQFLFSNTLLIELGVEVLVPPLMILLAMGFLYAILGWRRV
jgi:hypothetical protein